MGPLRFCGNQNRAPAFCFDEFSLREPASSSPGSAITIGAALAEGDQIRCAERAAVRCSRIATPHSGRHNRVVSGTDGRAGRSGRQRSGRSGGHCLTVSIGPKAEGDDRNTDHCDRKSDYWWRGNSGWPFHGAYLIGIRPKDKGVGR